MSAGRPQTPSGGGCIVPPTTDRPWVSVSTKALRSSASTSARRMSGLSNGAAVRFTSRLTLRFIDVVSQIAAGASFFTNLRSFGVTSHGKVRSKRPATKLSAAVEGLFTIVKSIASR